jgi:menaquinone-dependent protoporphyrinogen oxidase
MGILTRITVHREAVKMKVLVAYATGHGATAEIGQFIRDALREKGLDVVAENVADVTSVAGYDAFIIGSPIYGNMWRTEFSQFLGRFAAALQGKPTFMFISCIRVLESDGPAYVQKEYLYWPMLEKAGIQQVQVFSGKLDLKTTNFEERWTLAARWDSETLPDMRNGDFRDWEAIRTWAEDIAAKLK